MQILTRREIDNIDLRFKECIYRNNKFLSDYYNNFTIRVTDHEPFGEVDSENKTINIYVPNNFYELHEDLANPSSPYVLNSWRNYNLPPKLRKPNTAAQVTRSITNNGLPFSLEPIELSEKYKGIEAYKFQFIQVISNHYMSQAYIAMGKINFFHTPNCTFSPFSNQKLGTYRTEASLKSAVKREWKKKILNTINGG